MSYFKDKLQAFFNKKPAGIYDPFCITFELGHAAVYKLMALQAVINFLTAMVTSCEFRCYENNKETKGENYYLFNISPNDGQSSFDFWRNAIAELVIRNEALIVQWNDQLFLADSFERNQSGYARPTYSRVNVGGREMMRSFRDKEVIYLKWRDEALSDIADGISKDFSKMISSSQDEHVRDRLQKIILNVPANYPQTEDAQKKLNELVSNRLKEFLSSDKSAAVSLTGGITVSQLSSGRASSSGAQSKIGDSRALIEDMFDLVAIASGIAPVILKGNLAESKEAFNNTLAICVKPLLNMIETEINRKYFGKDGIRSGNLLKIDSSMVRVSSLDDIAQSLDILTRIGVYSPNDGRSVLGKDPIQEDWADDHILTKNYDFIENLRKASG